MNEVDARISTLSQIFRKKVLARGARRIKADFTIKHEFQKSGIAHGYFACRKDRNWYCWDLFKLDISRINIFFSIEGYHFIADMCDHRGNGTTLHNNATE